MITRKNAWEKKAVRIGLPALVLTVLVLIGIRYAGPRSVSPEEVLINNEEVIAMLRRGLKEYSREITISFEHSRDIYSELPEFTKQWMEAAMEETAEPMEGDYIRYQNGGYESSFDYSWSGEAYIYTITITPKYYMYLVQEEAVAQRLDEIFAEFSFDDTTTDYEKIVTIYDYICSHVSYDRVHRSNSYYYLRSTSYAALIYESATCQGYCVTLYRMLRQAGVRTRIITGSAYGEAREGLHAWNIVELDGAWYYLDATWDAGREIDDYEYFLKGSNEFASHTPGEEFLTGLFSSRYQIAEESYPLSRGGMR